MKKISIITAAVLAFSAVVPMCASADPAADYAPTFYFRPVDAPTDQKTGDLVLFKDEIPEEGRTLKINLYVSDESKQLWWFSPKWKCADSHIKLAEINDPSTSSEPFAYSKALADGSFINDNIGIDVVQDEECNTMGCTFTVKGLSLNPLVPYSENTDDYPMTWFTADVSGDIPFGYYDIYFLTKAEDYDDQRVTEAFLRLDNKDSSKRVPILENLTIRISGNEGDVNGDGIVDSADSSDILTEYAALQTSSASTLSPEAAFAADVDHDRVIDSADATLVLNYYAYAMSTESPVSFLEYAGIKPVETQGEE